MIIRSQNKLMLEKFQRANVDYGCSTVYVNGFPFGKYSTEEKAIKVLDDIFVAFRNTAFVDVVTYQMPQDSEV